mmetsp:Transcript_149611/g.372414  ORF Transcript_149611/g.372414 Transcript_149611/m.372414 type:complete len:206 (-) Transcript_149611:471-1088(-)
MATKRRFWRACLVLSPTTRSGSGGRVRSKESTRTKSMPSTKSCSTTERPSWKRSRRRCKSRRRPTSKSSCDTSCKLSRLRRLPLSTSGKSTRSPLSSQPTWRSSPRTPQKTQGKYSPGCAPTTIAPQSPWALRLSSISPRKPKKSGLWKQSCRSKRIGWMRFRSDKKRVQSQSSTTSRSRVPPPWCHPSLWVGVNSAGTTKRSKR